MKLLTITLKDLKRSFRSAFLLMFMFVIPLLMTGMFSLMFANTSPAQASSAATQPPTVTRIVVANLDQGSQSLRAKMEALAPGASSPTAVTPNLGERIVASLQDPSLKDVVQVSLAVDEAAARRQVEDHAAAAAVIIPGQFSAAFATSGGQAAIALYTDPTQSAGSSTAVSILGQILDRFSGARIAFSLAESQASAQAGGISDGAALGTLMQGYLGATQSLDPASLLEVRLPPSPDPAAKKAANPAAQAVSGIMGGMLIFFAFFTGGATAQSILKEDEEGTLARLFTTPTPLWMILGGKFLAVGLTVLVQVGVLLAASALIFGIAWGSLASLTLVAGSITFLSAAFGIFLTSLLKTSRQGGVVFGGLMTVAGMAGMMSIFTGSELGSASLGGLLPLLTPQGWAVRGLLLSMHSASLADAALNFLVMAGLSLVFFAFAALRFQKRFA